MRLKMQMVPSDPKFYCTIVDLTGWEKRDMERWFLSSDELTDRRRSYFEEMIWII
jgi:hypothetical protein